MATEEPVATWVIDPSRPDYGFLRGDVNRDGSVSIADFVFLRRYLYLDAPEPVCLDAADANDDGKVNLADAIAVVHAIVDNVILPEPYPLPGVTATMGDLDCLSALVIPGESTEDLVRVGTVDAAPGQDVLVPIFLTNLLTALSVQAFV